MADWPQGKDLAYIKWAVSPSTVQQQLVYVLNSSLPKVPRKTPCYIGAINLYPAASWLQPYVEEL
jgi:hypothetical protein